jgi:hypothetical protein
MLLLLKNLRCCSTGKDFDWLEGAGVRWFDFLPSLARELERFDRKLEFPEGLSLPVPWGEKEAALTFILGMLFFYAGRVPGEGSPF